MTKEELLELLKDNTDAQALINNTLTENYTHKQKAEALAIDKEKLLQDIETLNSTKTDILNNFKSHKTMLRNEFGLTADAPLTSDALKAVLESKGAKTQEEVQKIINEKAEAEARVSEVEKEYQNKLYELEKARIVEETVSKLGGIYDLNNEYVKNGVIAKINAQIGKVGDEWGKVRDAGNGSLVLESGGLDATINSFESDTSLSKISDGATGVNTPNPSSSNSTTNNTEKTAEELEEEILAKY